jgi:hypothetical protein
MSTLAARRRRHLRGTTPACAPHPTRPDMPPRRRPSSPALSSPSRAPAAQSAARTSAASDGPLLALSPLPLRAPTAADTSIPIPSRTRAARRLPRCSTTAQWPHAVRAAPSRAILRLTLRAVRESSGRMPSDCLRQTATSVRHKTKRQPTRGCPQNDLMIIWRSSSLPPISSPTRSNMVAGINGRQHPQSQQHNNILHHGAGKREIGCLFVLR